MNILFDAHNNPYPAKFIETTVRKFGHSYTMTVRNIISRSETDLSQKIFFENVAQLMPNFRMTRQGCFKGVKCIQGLVQDPNDQIAICWSACGQDVQRIRAFLTGQNINRRRILVDMSASARQQVIIDLRKTFNFLIPVCMGRVANGFVGASKVLFSVLPEVTLPVDTIQWRKLFRTNKYGEIITLMADEISAWEKQTHLHLDSCDTALNATLPSIYNVMAMKARP